MENEENPIETPASPPSNRDDRGRFRPGFTANPSGRPKDVSDVKRLATKMSSEMLGLLADIARNRRASATARVAAAREILDRGLGKPPQSLEIAPKIERPPEELTDAELLEIARHGRLLIEGDTAELHPEPSRLPEPPDDE